LAQETGLTVFTLACALTILILKSTKISRELEIQHFALSSCESRLPWLNKLVWAPAGLLTAYGRILTAYTSHPHDHQNAERQTFHLWQVGSEEEDRPTLCHLRCHRTRIHDSSTQASMLRPLQKNWFYEVQITAPTAKQNGHWTED
jgi:hypothetical protein